MIPIPLAQAPETRRTRLPWVVYLCGGMLAVGYVGYATWRVFADDSDLIDFHLTSLHWWRTGEFSTEFGVRHYLPVFVVLMAPLVAWPLAITAPCWAALNIIFFILALRECTRLTTPAADTVVPPKVQWLWPAVMIFPYVSDTIALGQVNLLTLLLCVVVFTRCWQPRRDVLAGLLLALAACIKIYPLFLSLFWLAKGRYRAFLAAIGFFVLLAGGLSLLAFGQSGTQEAHRAWLAEVRGEKYSSSAAGSSETNNLQHLIFHEKPNQFLRHNNQSLATIVRRLTTTAVYDAGGPRRHLLALSVSTSYRIYLAMAAAILLALLAVAWQRRAKPAPMFEWGAWLAALVAFMPIYWTHYFVLGLPAVALLATVARADRQARKGWTTSMILAVAWLAAIPLLGSRTMRLFGLHAWILLAVAFWCLYRRHGASARVSLDSSITSGSATTP